MKPEDPSSKALHSTRFVRLNEVVVDWERHCVLRDGEAVAVEPRAMAFLARLCAEPGIAISREEAIRSVWNGTHVVDEAVMRVVSVLRSALGDESRTPRYIETVPKRGYRLIAALSEVERPSSVSQRGSRRNMVLMGLGLAVAFAAGWGASALTSKRPSPPLHAVNTITGEVTELPYP